MTKTNKGRIYDTAFCFAHYRNNVETFPISVQNILISKIWAFYIKNT